MTRDQANVEAEKIFKERTRRREEIINAAKKNGTWSPGLDANKSLFKTLDEEMKIRLRELSASIDE